MALDTVAADTRASASTESISVRPDFAVLRRVRPGAGAVIGTEEGNEFMEPNGLTAMEAIRTPEVT